MHSLKALLKKELRSYFNSPVAYIVALIAGLFPAAWLYYVQQFYAADYASLQGYFSSFPFLIIIIIPALTMKSWAEERRAHTEELLMSLPLREGQLVLGKFLASFIFLILLLVLTLPVPLTLNPLGDFSTGEIVSQYLGVALLGAAGIAVGQMISSLTRHQLIAFLFTALFLLGITVLWQVARLMGLPESSGRLLRWFSLEYHFQSFSKGVIDSRDLVFFILMIWIPLYLNTKILILRKWM